MLYLTELVYMRMEVFCGLNWIIQIIISPQCLLRKSGLRLDLCAEVLFIFMHGKAGFLVRKIIIITLAPNNIDPLTFIQRRHQFKISV